MGEEGAIAMSSQLGQKKVDVENPHLGSSNSWANSEVSSVTKRNICSTCVTIVDLVNHVLIVSLTVFTLYYTVGPYVSQIHATLCTLGYILMMSEAIVVFADDGVLTNFLTHRAKKHLHWVLQLLGLILVIAGFVPMYLAKHSHHFKSYHAILGITSLVVMVFLTVTGYPVFVAAKLRQVVRPVVIKFGHNFLGISCFVIGMASQCLGYKYTSQMNTPSVNVTTICIIVCVSITLLSVRKALPTLFQQSARLFR
ncbi:transmembrane reductase CYB561D2 [Frieseomelitta varia]|uniref:transmembrane reductase CYB561D2 n=1 Tax=Frieseomelitta varia TaxID=561572 RepID=UPI001CB6B19C|nr:transmembrane reductase CYB561D2 [Frieseomelitta varia]